METRGDGDSSNWCIWVGLAASPRPAAIFHLGLFHPSQGDDVRSRFRANYGRDILVGDDLMTGPPSPLVPPEIASHVLEGVDLCDGILRSLGMNSGLFT
ncbi:hypothetical protein K1719_038630 [Acacia pycnantha]|nr:hypothetical protein K1719_038630 [Acacia pycnantha]